MSGRIYKSECGKYLCRSTGDCAHFEAWKVDGSLHWVDDDRIKTWEDARKRRHPLPYAVGVWSCTRASQKKGSFTLTLLHCDTRKYVKPFAGNTIIESIDVVFRRKVPWQNVPRWLKDVIGRNA